MHGFFQGAVGKVCVRLVFTTVLFFALHGTRGEARRAMASANAKRKTTGVRRGDDVWIKIKPYRDAPVRGTVKDVLTRRTDHPRGIKVRLTDGRIGRVTEGAQDEERAAAVGAAYGIAGVIACAACAAWLMR